MDKLGQGPAFSSIEEVQYENGEKWITKHGMSKRFYAACCAMKAIISKDTHFNNNLGLPDIKTTISEAYAYADELLKQEND